MNLGKTMVRLTKSPIRSVLAAGVILSLLINFLCISYIYVYVKEGPSSHITADSSTHVHVTAERSPIHTSETGAKGRRLAQLECEGLENTDRMVYWSEILEQPPHVSKDDEKFLLFDEDVAGWNNKRISFEIFAILAKITDRTLVLPPMRGGWFGLFSRQMTREEAFTFTDVLDVRGIRIISLEQFLLSESKNLGMPPQNRTDWSLQAIRDLRIWLKEVTHPLTWKVEECLLGIPKEDDQIQPLSKALESLAKQKYPRHHWDKPLQPSSASLEDRMSQLVVYNQSSLCFYDKLLQSERYLYYQISTDGALSMVFTRRLLIWFYQFIFFEDWHQDLRIKRWVRDSLRYKDEHQCTALRIVNQLSKFHSLHIRRSSQFEHQFGKQPTADDIYLSIKDLMEEGSKIYIATDEPDREFFQPLMDHYRVFFLGDFSDALADVSPKYYGMIEQLVASQGELFVGSWSSTFSNFIIRMRGYMSQVRRLKGFEEGLLVNTFFYNQPGQFRAMHSYHTPRKAWFLRESPIVWHGIDQDLESPDEY